MPGRKDWRTLLGFFRASPTSMGNIRSKLTAPLLALVATLPLQLHAQSSPVTPAQARVIVKLRSDSLLLPKVAAAGVALRPMHARALGQRLGVAMNDGAPLGERTQVVAADGVTSTDLARRLSSEADVEYAVPDLRRH